MRGLRAAAQPTVLATIDQVLSSASNWLVVVALARSGGPGDTGEFALAFSAYLLALVVVNSVVGEPAYLGRMHQPSDVVVSGAILGAVAGIPVSAVGLLMDSGAMVIIGAGLPLLMAHESMRYALFATGRVDGAVVLDAIWTGVSGLALIVPGLSPEWGAGLWVGGAGVAVASKLSREFVRAHALRPALRWLTGHAAWIGTVFLADSVLVWVSTQGLLWIAAEAFGLGLAGEMRLAHMFAMPIQWLTIGAVRVYGPRRVEKSRQGAKEPAQPLWSLVVAAGAVGFVLTVAAEPLLRLLAGPAAAGASRWVMPAVLGTWMLTGAARVGTDARIAGDVGTLLGARGASIVAAASVVGLSLAGGGVSLLVWSEVAASGTYVAMLWGLHRHRVASSVRAEA